MSDDFNRDDAGRFGKGNRAAHQNRRMGQLIPHPFRLSQRGIQQQRKGQKGGGHARPSCRAASSRAQPSAVPGSPRRTQRSE